MPPEQKTTLQKVEDLILSLVDENASPLETSEDLESSTIALRQIQEIFQNADLATTVAADDYLNRTFAGLEEKLRKARHEKGSWAIAVDFRQEPAQDVPTAQEIACRFKLYCDTRGYKARIYDNEVVIYSDEELKLERMPAAYQRFGVQPFSVEKYDNIRSRIEGRDPTRQNIYITVDVPG
jgi:hypothetical protein